MSRKLKIIFTISVLLNVFLIGLVVGSSSRAFKHEFHERAERGHRLTEFISILPEEERPRFKENMESLVKTNEEARKKMRSIRRDIATIFETEPFDAELYYKKTQEIHALRGVQMAEGSRIIGEISEYLPKEQRAKLADRLVKGHKRLGKFRESRQMENRFLGTELDKEPDKETHKESHSLETELHK